MKSSIVLGGARLMAVVSTTAAREGSIARSDWLDVVICRLVAGLILGLALPILTRAQTQMPMVGHNPEMIDQIPPEQLPAPRRLSGIGNAHIPITANREAQQWFDQGLNLYHDFWDYESARAFQQGIRADPQCAMCYWGLYKAEGFFHSNAPGYAAPMLAKAVALQTQVSEHERLYIRATAADFQSSVPIWRQLVSQFPDDLEAQIFLAQSPIDGEESLAILEHVMRADPQNSAAHHYYIHELEASPHPDRALHSAEMLGRLAPSSGHVVHMPGHIFFRMGDYAGAERAFAESLRVDERYMREQHVDPDNDWNYVHNLMYAIANLMEQGKFKIATTLSRKLTNARGRLPSTLYVYSTRDSISRIDPQLPVALRTADWVRSIALLSGSSVPPNRPNLAWLATQLKRFAEGMHAVEDHRLPDAERVSDELDHEIEAVTARLKTPAPAVPAPPASIPNIEIMPDALLPPLAGTLSVMSQELQAAVLMAGGKVTESEAAFSRAAASEQSLGYREPPIYIRPVRETEGVSRLAAHDWSGARKAFQSALVQRPRSGFALFGLARCNEEAGDQAGALAAYAEFLRVWKGADRSLPQVLHARAYVANERRHRDPP